MIRAAKRYARNLEQRYLLRRGVHHFRGELASGHISTDAIAEIWLGWGNTGFSASPQALLELCRLAQENGNRLTLELGGGVSTLLLSLLSERWPLQVVTIESDAQWCSSLRARVASFGLQAPDVRHAPLVTTDDCMWYDTAMLPKPESIGLVFCDGPPGDTIGGRSGALSLLAPLLPSSVCVLIDDTNREAEDQLSRDWSASHNLKRSRFLLSRDRAFDVLAPNE